MLNEYEARAAAFKRVVTIERELAKKATTCEMIIDLVIKELLANGATYHFFTMESLLNVMQNVQEEIIVELSHARIQKGLHAFLMKQARINEG
ncbi:hypothetical protein ACFSR7_34430 [Cohnella sp. GCM10020058]|uniref:hypothetical protein n=1 Tax=Cohnella sp. GCM10020058 TaxID=3317330 RepID=UPI00362C27D2